MYSNGESFYQDPISSHRPIYCNNTPLSSDHHHPIRSHVIVRPRGHVESPPNPVKASPRGHQRLNPPTHLSNNLPIPYPNSSPLTPTLPQKTTQSICAVRCRNHVLSIISSATMSTELTYKDVAEHSSKKVRLYPSPGTEKSGRDQQWHTD